jgi:hypothetical protein
LPNQFVRRRQRRLSCSKAVRAGARGLNPRPLCVRSRNEVARVTVRAQCMPRGSLNLAYRWFCRLGLDGRVPDHSSSRRKDTGAFARATCCDAVALQTAMEGRARQMRDGRLQGVEAVVERQQGMLSESDDHRLFFRGQDRRFGFLWPSRQIGDRSPPLPLGDGLLIDSVARGQSP